MTHWKQAVVTGAAGGIGRAFAEELARRGASLGIMDVDAEGVGTVATALRERGTRVCTRAVDVADGGAAEEAVAALAGELEGIDLVVHCAAILGPGPFATQSAADFDRVVRIDLLGTANIVRATVPWLRRSHGSLACLASTAAVHGWPGLAAYSAAKFGVAGFCDAIRMELQRDGVHLVSVFPLLIDTPLLRASDIPPILKTGKRLPPATVVDKTLAAIAARRPRAFIPGSVRVLAALHGIAPSLLDWYARRYGF